MNLPQPLRSLFETLPKRVLRGTAVAAFDTSYKMSSFLARFTAAKKLAQKGKSHQQPAQGHIGKERGVAAQGNLHGQAQVGGQHLQGNLRGQFEYRAARSAFGPEGNHVRQQHTQDGKGGEHVPEGYHLLHGRGPTHDRGGTLDLEPEGAHCSGQENDGCADIKPPGKTTLVVHLV